MSSVGGLTPEYPDEAYYLAYHTDGFKLLHRWFEGFYRRYRISLRRKTHAAQKPPATLRTAIENSQAKSLQERKR